MPTVQQPVHLRAAYGSSSPCEGFTDHRIRPRRRVVRRPAVGSVRHGQFVAAQFGLDNPLLVSEFRLDVF